MVKVLVEKAGVDGTFRMYVDVWLSKSHTFEESQTGLFKSVF